MSVVYEETIQIGDLTRPGGLACQCVDVRSATEFTAGHIPGAINIPMDEIECRLGDLPSGRIALVCQSGKRASMTQALLAGRVDNLSIVSGGTDAWVAAGLPLIASTRSRWALERQVRLIAGLLVLTATLLGLTVSRAWFGLAAFVGAGLAVAGITNFCAMAHLLALLPWNRRRSTIGSPTCDPQKGT